MISTNSYPALGSVTASIEPVQHSCSSAAHIGTSTPARLMVSLGRMMPKVMERWGTMDKGSRRVTSGEAGGAMGQIRDPYEQSRQRWSPACLCAVEQSLSRNRNTDLRRCERQQGLWLMGPKLSPSLTESHPHRHGHCHHRLIKRLAR